MKEPVIHSHITDVLPDDNPLQKRVNERDEYASVDCDACGCMLHDAVVNECMRTWFETGKGNFCWACFTKEDRSVMGDQYALV